MLNHLFLAAISQSLCQICISSTSEASRRTQIMLSIFTVAGGLGGFWLDPICVNLLVQSALSSLWYASEIRQWYYCKRIDSPRGEGRIYREREREEHTQRREHAHTDRTTHSPGKEKKIRIWQWERKKEREEHTHTHTHFKIMNWNQGPALITRCMMILNFKMLNFQWSLSWTLISVTEQLFGGGDLTWLSQYQLNLISHMHAAGLICN